MLTAPTYNDEKTLIITPTTEKLPVNRGGGSFVVTKNNLVLNKIVTGSLSILFLLAGFYLILGGNYGENNFSIISPIASPVPTPGSGFTRIDPEREGMPEGWERIYSQDGTFGIGYNLQTMKAAAGSNRITLSGVGQDIHYSMELFPFDGGGRQEFILKKMKVIDVTGLGSDSNTHEEIYDIGERRALIIYGVDYNGMTIVGMLQKDETNAFLIQSSGLSQKQAEQILFTTRIL
jgi:hypothetical protein